MDELPDREFITRKLEEYERNIRWGTKALWMARYYIGLLQKRHGDFDRMDEQEDDK